MNAQLQEICSEGHELLSLQPNELELRYTDWVAKVKTALVTASADCGVQVDTIDTTAELSLRQRTEEILGVLDLQTPNIEPTPPLS